MDPDLQQTLLSPWFLGLIGLCVGSFLNVVIYRLPVMMQRQWLSDCAEQLSIEDDLRQHATLDEAQARSLSTSAVPLREAVDRLPALTLVRPASRCPHCGHQLRWHENLPLIGWLRLRGRCASCQAPISARYPIVELLTGALFFGIAWRVGAQPAALLYCGFAAALVALAGIDWDTTLLPDSINQPLLWAGLVAAGAGWIPVALQDALIGAVAGYLSLWSIYWVFKLATGKEGMGYGDFKLLAALGAWLGWQMVLPVALSASLLGAVVGIALKLRGALREGRYVPFGPFLAGGGLATLLIGPAQVAVWLGLQAH
ncbi:prepilin peptidase [Roseateles aquatilis]|uniref:Prepilin leader peptidase/N-methyltransferase n=1 Tax=Roseateles aquatilis TaxID=431061 RepID=A0A246ITS3_9BURK|nr:A24 family peptidase [Roseateles aquatilis]OWQ83622.1 prepilin peptidase [Roseateles aquatilis]